MKTITLSEFLKAFGYNYNDKVQFVAWDKTNYRNNRRADLNLRPSAIDILKKWSNGGTVNIGFVPNGGRSDSDIEECNVVFCEFDDGSTLDEQLQKLAFLGYEPNIILNTGNKSHHFYWLLNEPIEPEEFSKFQRDLAIMIGSDIAVSNPARTMRLPFFKHPKSGISAKVIKFDVERKVQFRFLRSIVPSQTYTAATSVVKPNNEQGDSKPILKFIDLLEDAKVNNRTNKLESRCPSHKGESDTVFYVNLNTGSFKCCAGCSNSQILSDLNKLSKIAGTKQS